MSTVTVIGSGASGVHFALTALRKGHDVIMLDVGHSKPSVEAPDFTFDELKHELADPARYFLGRQFESVTLPSATGEVYAFPPNKRYIFEGVTEYEERSSGIEPLVSFAQGGLAEAWTGGVYPFNDDDLHAFPFAYIELAPYYSEVARRIGVNGAADDLSRFMPVHDDLLKPLELDRHAQALLRSYERRRHALNKLGCYVGRSRIATLTRDQEARSGCTYCGRCMWGCPTGALYTPSMTLQECLQYRNFRYLSGEYVTHFTYDDARRITAVLSRSAAHGTRELPVERLVLAAGTLSSSRIVLESVYRKTGEVRRLTGLMDNRQVLVPYLNLRLLGSNYETRAYQYHQVALGIAAGTGQPGSYVHGQVTTFTTGLVHPILQSLPLDLTTAVSMFRTVRAALGIVNVNLHDTRRSENYVTIEPNGAGPSRLVLHYSPTPDEAERIERATSRVRKALRRLGCMAPRAMTQVRPMGASVHYSGTLPMSERAQRDTVSPLCQSHDFENLSVADGSTFPFLPAKNLTFTLMANATRVADRTL